MKKPLISMISAVAENNVIGADNDMPWHLSTDLKRFKAVTLGKPVIMGRRTFESVGKALPGRLNVVITRNVELQLEGAEMVSSLEEAIAVSSRDGQEEIMITGGGEIYRQALPLADKLYITHVAACPEGDTVFPTIERDIWDIVHEESVPQGEKDSATTLYRVYERK